VVWLELGAGLILLLLGGEALVRGAVGVATRLGVSPLVIGLTLVGFGTSTPELMASVQAALIGAPGIAVGNVVGSNIANILLILGLSAVILPVATRPRAFRRDGAALVVSALLRAGLALTGTIGRAAGLVFLAGLAGYTIYSFRDERHAAPDAPPVAGPLSLGAGLLWALGGIAAVVGGAALLVGSAVVIARAAGLSEAVIGLTLVAVGTSLPELATSVLAALRRQGDVAFGNIVGSNIFNILGILGVTGLVAPVAVPAEVLALDLWVMLGVTGLLAVFAVSGWRVSRGEGAVFLVLYGLYLAVQFTPALRGALGLPG
jgi:cation:H+ antiporter